MKDRSENKWLYKFQSFANEVLVNNAMAQLLTLLFLLTGPQSGLLSEL